MSRASDEAYGVVATPSILTIRRLLPGPIDRVWAYLTDSDLRQTWLASGAMDPRVGADFEFVWRNDLLTPAPGQRPAGFAQEHRMQSRITEYDPPRRLSFTWEGTGDVTFALEPVGSEVMLTVTHRFVSQRDTLLSVSAGWHMHIDILAARLSGRSPEPFWDGWNRLRTEYAQRLPE